MADYDPTMHDVCECGCYRFQHWRGTGPCIFNKDDPVAPGLGHAGAPDCHEFRLALPHAESLKERQFNKCQKTMECEVCHKHASDGTDLYRVNEKGVPGRWRCLEHMETDPPEDVRRVVEFLSLKEHEMQAPRGWRWNPRTGALERT